MNEACARNMPREMSAIPLIDFGHVADANYTGRVTPGVAMAGGLTRDETGSGQSEW
jgi:hypothetical protein